MGSWYDMPKTIRLFVIAQLRQWAIMLRNFPRVKGIPRPGPQTRPTHFTEDLASAFGMAAEMLVWCPRCKGEGSIWVETVPMEQRDCPTCKGSGKAP